MRHGLSHPHICSTENQTHWCQSHGEFADVEGKDKKKDEKESKEKKQHQENSLGVIWSYSSCWIFTKMKLCTPQQETTVSNRGNITRDILLVLWGCHSKWHILWSNKQQLLQIPEKREINGIELSVSLKMPQRNYSHSRLSRWALRDWAQSQTERKDLFPSGNDADVSEKPSGLCSST